MTRRFANVITLMCVGVSTMLLASHSNAQSTDAQAAVETAGLWSVDKDHLKTVMTKLWEESTPPELQEERRQNFEAQLKNLVNNFILEFDLLEDGTMIFNTRDVVTGAKRAEAGTWSREGDSLTFRNPNAAPDMAQIEGTINARGAIEVSVPGLPVPIELIPADGRALVPAKEAQPESDPFDERMDKFLDNVEAALDTQESIDMIIESLEGAWFDENAGRTVSYTRFELPGMRDLLLLDTSDGIDALEPGLKRILRVFEASDGLRIRYYHIGSSDLTRVFSVAPHMDFDANPDFAQILADALIPVTDFKVSMGESGFTAATNTFPIDLEDAIDEQITLEYSSVDETFSTAITFTNEKGETRFINNAYVRAQPQTKVTKLDSGLVIISDNAGEGEPVEQGDRIEMHYYGMLTNGTKFDASYDRNTTFGYEFPGQVIQGWQRGLEGVRVGERRRLIIPAQLGYGPRAVGPIPPNSTLVFDVECVSITPAEGNNEQP